MLMQSEFEPSVSSDVLPTLLKCFDYLYIVHICQISNPFKKILSVAFGFDGKVATLPRLI